MKIVAIETVLFEPTWDDPFSGRHRRTVGAVTLRTDDGLEGISRTSGDGARHIHERFKPLLLGEDPRNVERLWAKLYRQTVPYLGQEPALLAAIGALDIGANVMFATALTVGMAGLVSVLGSLYPLATVILARAVLREQVSGTQRTGVAAALAGIALVSFA